MVMQPGLIMLIGAGETSSSGHKFCDWLLSRLPSPINIAILETPAGFELNSDVVAGRVADFFRRGFQNYQPEVSIIPARKRGTAYSPDDPAIVMPLLRAGAIFLGPGSPTYAARQLDNSLAWAYVIARHRLGAAIVLASAAAIAAGAYALPVYEIYEVGDELHWDPGLDLFGPYGLSLVIVSHWDNTDGGDDLDTSRCYMGRARFERLLALLPPDVTVVGIDEHTALVVDLGAETCRVMGRGGVTLLRGGQEMSFANGQTFSVHKLGPFHPLSSPELGLPPHVWRAASLTERA